MGIFEAVKKGFGMAAKAMGVVLVLFIFNVVWGLINIPLTPAPGTTPTPPATLIALMASIIFVLTSVFIQSGSLALVRDQIKTGSMRLGSFAGYGAKYYIRLFLINLLMVLIIVVGALLAGLLVALTAPVKNAVLTIIATAIAIAIAVLTLYYLLLLAMSPYALVCEDVGALEALKRSFRVVKRSVLKVLLFVITVLLIALGIGLIVGFVVGAATAFLPAAAGQVIMAVVSGAINGYIAVVMIAAFISFYLGLTAQTTSTEKVFK